MSNYQEQYDIAHEVLEITDSEGFKTLLTELQSKVTQVTNALGRANSDMVDAVKREGVDSERYVQKVVALSAELNGLQFITNQVELHRKRKESAAKHLD